MHGTVRLCRSPGAAGALAEILALFRTPEFGGPMPARSGHVQVTGRIPGGCVSCRKVPPVWDLLPVRRERPSLGLAHLLRMGRRLARTGAPRQIVPLIPRFRDGLVPAALRSAISRPVPARRASTDFVPASLPVIRPHPPVAALRARWRGVRAGLRCIPGACPG
ncbi:hypothetical protein ACTIVE_4456 [Actinomadura verrucosospora]|uniref:Uncharacterized protein n=1 Tax=Actinomadura verrucosospora TaxID=46165 RepID=A0A7D3VTE6_ACTVE|nr:hypothetical protein ACTIVE_4456 [Actinomadura verrucosospora]